MSKLVRDTDYSPREWEDRVVDEATQEVLVEGTPYNEAEMNRIEAGILVGNLDVGLAVLMAMQLANLNKQELEKLSKQRLLQGQATINNDVADNGYFRASEPFVTVALEGFAQINAPNYDVVLTPTDDQGDVGRLIAYDKTQNGFKVKMTGSAKSVSFLWTLINPRV